MNEEKLSSDKVPQKFAEWLLSMGCPPDKVPTVDKLSEMCRGQYYMVWRSLMEHVEPKEVIRQKRLQVFNDDVQRCRKTNAFCKPDSSTIVPEELTLWKQQTTLRERVQDAETRVQQARQELNQLVDKVSSRLSHRNLARARVAAAQRRAWLLQQLGEELRAKRDSLNEARTIADSLCSFDDCSDVENKLDKLTSRRQTPRAPAALSVSMAPLASSSITSNGGDMNDSEEQISSLVRCGGALWPQLCERRAALTAALAATTDRDTSDTNRITPQWVLSHTASLHCSLALNSVKNKVHTKRAQKKLADSLTQINDYLSGEACELLVVRCERARAQARVDTLRTLHEEVTSRTGVFEAAGGAPDTQATRHILAIDKAIESKRDELKRLITSLAVTERKIHNVRECLTTVFNGFHTDTGCQGDRFGGQLSLPQESISTLRRFYEERRDRNRNKVNLSMDLDTSENCSYDAAENMNPTFTDELKVYLKKFKLENNRKLVLDNGEKVWIFETLQSSVDRLHSSWQRDDVTCSLVCPSVSLSRNLQRIILTVQKKYEMEALVKVLESSLRRDVSIDISSETEEETNTIDRIKKRLNDNLVALQKTVKTLDLGQENLQLWSDNSMKKYISSNRTIDGKTYKEYEANYLESLNLNM
ncbi:uncharacterized protein LOC118277385 [Spodoptera frugiperda]|uniref:Uncharacterized protein LOC118277385 n=1 Tax=Spodoptera frugiperda TaxID=7108 RepID=A0A9R0DS24_SPOFR|nr:uncharacterized protein LOC118277385 [Spodoptera frugiperda]